MSQERRLIEEWIRQNPGIATGTEYAISGAEGTMRGGKPGYNVMFGGGTFKDFSRHPNKVIRSPGGYASAAAGAPQFLPGTYAELQKRLGLPDFSPKSQRLAMFAKIRERLLPLGGLTALSKAGTLTPEIQAALAPEWASFPTMSGKSYYGQPVKKASEIQRFFEQGMKVASPQVTDTGTQAPPTPPPPVSSVLAPILGTDLEQSEKKKTLSQTFLQQVLRGILPAGGLIPSLFGNVR
jgi:muramidase (phage lysozyme)